MVQLARRDPGQEAGLRPFEDVAVGLGAVIFVDENEVFLFILLERRR